MARLYADEDFDYPIVVELRRLGHDVLTVEEAGQANQRIALFPRAGASMPPVDRVWKAVARGGRGWRTVSALRQALRRWAKKGARILNPIPAAGGYRHGLSRHGRARRSA